MISSALATLILLAAPNATAQAREGYARCLKDLVRTSAEQKVDATAFESTLAASCKDKEAAFKSARIASDIALGLKRASAEKAMADELADYRSMAKEELLEALKASAPQ